MDAKSINEICAPLSKAKTLPVECYVNSDWYKTEIETIFEHDWLFVARLEEIPNKGDYITLESVREHHFGLHSFRSMRRMEASLRKASAL